MINCRDATRLRCKISFFHLSYSLFLCPPPPCIRPGLLAAFPLLSLHRSLSAYHASVNTSVKFQTWFFHLSLPILIPIKKWNLVLGDRFHYILNEFIGFRGSISRAEILLYRGHPPCGMGAEKLRKNCGEDTEWVRNGFGIGVESPHLFRTHWKWFFELINANYNTIVISQIKLISNLIL